MDYDGRRWTGEEGLFDASPYTIEPVNMGEMPPLTKEDIILICDDLYDGGNVEEAHQVLDLWYDAKHNREEQVRRFLKTL